MLHDAGDNADFGPDRINSIQELEILQKAKAVAVVNCATNSKGTQLTDHVFRNSPKALHFIDPADIKKREQEFLNSLKSISEITNVLSINETNLQKSKKPDITIRILKWCSNLTNIHLFNFFIRRFKERYINQNT